ncbi:MAG: serine hydrolase [Gammaproteobacteria bacterium]|nr:serine hydrolase [Gammaproteobacteria bacterium]NKB64386.1 serine hydrolase [Gammaproteobacteria bacterium]
MNIERLAQVSDFMQRYVETGKTAGIQALVFHRGQEVFFDQVGYRDLETKTPMEEDTIFRIYSMTKAITSVCLMSLLEEGHFQLDDPVEWWIPEMSDLLVYGEGGKLDVLTQAVTFRHLLTHTAGFTYGFEPDTHPIEKQYADLWRVDGPPKHLPDLIRDVLKIPLLFQPGSQWNYSVATDICGYLVELISGQTLAEFMQQRIFDPLGMADTSFVVSRKDAHRLATLYGYKQGQAIEILSRADDLPYVDHTEGNEPRLYSGGAGLVSTARDYLKFARMLLNGGVMNEYRVLGRKTVEWMTQNHLDASLLPLANNGIVTQRLKSYGFGLGFCINLDAAKAGTLGSTGDFGWGGMADTYCWIDPQEQLIGILMQQFIPSLYHGGRRSFRNAVYQALT